MTDNEKADAQKQMHHRNEELSLTISQDPFDKDRLIVEVRAYSRRQLFSVDKKIPVEQFFNEAVECSRFTPGTEYDQLTRDCYD